MLRIALIALIATTATAFEVPNRAVQPLKTNVNIDAPLTKALELRGGGIISKVRA